MKKYSIVLFLLVGIFALVLRSAHAGPGPEGSVYVEPVTGSYAPNQSFTVRVGVNVGTSNKVNIISLKLWVDPTLTVESCTTDAGFKKIYGKDTCTISGNTITFFMQAANTEGPISAVNFGTLVLHGTANGGLKIAAVDEIVVKQADGQSVDYQITNMVNGNYQIGTSVTNTPTPTITPGAGISVTPTPTITSVPPTVTPGNTDPYGFPIGTKDQLTINIGQGGVTTNPGNGPKITFSTKLFGTEKNPDILVRLTATDLIAQITPIPGRVQYGCDVPGVGQYFYTNVPMHADSNGVYTPIPNGTYAYNGVNYSIDANGWITLVDVPTGTPISFGVKGPKHRNMKTLDNILLATGTPASQNFDWTSTLLEPGDLPDPQNGLKQDCTLNSVDLSLAISRIGSTANSDLTIADINFDGVINGNDISKIVNTMSRKPDDDR